MDLLKHNEMRDGSSQGRPPTHSAPGPFAGLGGLLLFGGNGRGQSVGFLLSLLLDGESTDES